MLSLRSFQYGPCHFLWLSSTFSDWEVLSLSCYFLANRVSFSFTIFPFVINVYLNCSILLCMKYLYVIVWLAVTLRLYNRLKVSKILSLSAKMNFSFCHNKINWNHHLQDTIGHFVRVAGNYSEFLFPRII